MNSLSLRTECGLNGGSKSNG